jgi:hypothetical protein
MRFDQVLETIENLSPDDQETLLAILERRWIARRRAIMVDEVREAREEFPAGQCQSSSAKDIRSEICT